MLVTTKEMLDKAMKEDYAIGAFNVENMEMVQAVVKAAAELSSPVILQTTPSTVRYGGLAYFFTNARVAAMLSNIPVAIHLDHGDSFDLAVQAIKEGYTSVMIDGSHADFQGNIALTRRVVEMAKLNNIPVEAELGKVGGKEDALEASDSGYTDIDEAAEFILILRRLALMGNSWSMIPIDKSGNALMENPIWQDNCSHVIMSAILLSHGEKKLLNISKNPFNSAYTRVKFYG